MTIRPYALLTVLQLPAYSKLMTYVTDNVKCYSDYDIDDMIYKYQKATLCDTSDDMCWFRLNIEQVGSFIASET
jgi:hypothetical protein